MTKAPVGTVATGTVATGLVATGLVATGLVATGLVATGLVVFIPLIWCDAFTYLRTSAAVLLSRTSNIPQLASRPYDDDDAGPELYGYRI